MRFPLRSADDVVYCVLIGTIDMKYATALFIDDDSDDLLLYQEAINEILIELSCHYYESSVNALNHLTRSVLKPDIIFLDLYMSTLSGQELLAKLKTHDTLKLIPVFILSSCNIEDEINQVKELGALEYFLKPQRFGDLISLLQGIFTNNN